MKLYHGTDIQAAKSIVEKSKFKIAENPKHWLGNGVYFFLDKKLAEWYSAKKPSKNFGTKIDTPAVVCTDIDINKVNFLDLRKLDDYNSCIHDFMRFWDLFVSYSKDKPVDFHLLICAFFNFIKLARGYNGVIGCFSLDSQTYINDNNQYFKEIGLNFIETQLCIFDNGLDFLSNYNYYNIYGDAKDGKNG